MKKIKNFKVTIRESQVLRLLKKTAQLQEITPQIEDAIKQERLRIEKSLTPAAMYDTFAKEKVIQKAGIDETKNLIAASVFVVTINRTLVEEINETQSRGENILSQILHSVAVEALEQSVNFVLRLLAEEAKVESCILGDKKTFSTGSEAEYFLSLLPGDKINIKYAKGKFDPIYSTCGVIPWYAQKKSGRQPT